VFAGVSLSGFANRRGDVASTLTMRSIRELVRLKFEAGPVHQQSPRLWPFQGRGRQVRAPRRGGRAHPRELLARRDAAAGAAAADPAGAGRHVRRLRTIHQGSAKGVTLSAWEEYVAAHPVQARTATRSSHSVTATSRRLASLDAPGASRR